MFRNIEFNILKRANKMDIDNKRKTKKGQAAIRENIYKRILNIIIK